ncbi:MAG: ferritin [Candidatus Diapherotrites archaeon CG10_big_fil_rev_8_21_14_0_10_31_34]|nr:MAG: ferritin [Candidatus Diapherotrites archaeon CG10_big_fil_rev_8_21_14_0_10_31_34]
MNKKIEDILNRQFNNEYYSSYLYLSMAAFFDSLNFEGFSHWMKKQAGEEMVHAMKLFDFVQERNGRMILTAVKAPETNWKSPLDAFENALAHEKLVTSQINKIFELSKTEKDYPTEVFIQWFIKEQVEEEDTALKIVEKLKMIKDSKQGLLMFDSVLAKRE